MDREIARKIAALEALAASTTFEGERANAAAAIAKLRSSQPDDQEKTAEDDEAREWVRTMEAAESDRIISDMTNRAYRFCCDLGCAIYKDGSQYVVVALDSIRPMTPGDVLNMAVCLGFEP